MDTPITRWRALVQAGALEPDPAQERAAQMLSVLHGRLCGWRPGKKRLLSRGSGPEPRGLYLHGAVGRGKSMLMDMFFETAPVTAKKRVHFHQFMLDIHAAMAHWRSLGTAARRRHKGYQRGAGDDPVIPVANALAQEARLLCLDEMQVTDIADAMVLGRLFEQLLAKKVVLVTTSNQPPDNLYKDGLGRERFTPFIAMLKARLNVLALVAARDYRLGRLTAHSTFFTPLNADTRARIEDAWSALTTGLRPHARSISLKGRRWRIERSAGGVARLDFESACGAARGAADYLELARQFHTLVLEDVPVLDEEKNSAAWRFMTLVDALYEARVKLVISAAAPPQALMAGAGRSDGFARTVSRLMEMQSDTYLAAGHGASGLIV